MGNKADEIAAAKQAEMEAQKNAAAKAVEDEAAKQEKLNAELNKQAEENLAKVLASDGDVSEDVVEDPKLTKGNEARDKLYRIALAYPRTSPDEHTIFGFGGERFSLGDLRSLFNLPGPRAG